MICANTPTIIVLADIMAEDINNFFNGSFSNSGLILIL